MKKIIVDSSEPVRLDRYIRRIFPSVTQGIIERYLRSGKIKVNESKVKSSTRIKNGDKITLYVELSPGSVAVKTFSDSTIALATKLMAEYLLWSTNEFIAINKPHNLAVQGGSKISVSIDEAISYLNTTNEMNLKLVHRLDKGTSGVLLIARDHNSAVILTKAFKDKLIEKTYYAVVCGHPQKTQGTLLNYIGKDRSGIFEIVKELKSGKMAETSYNVLKENDDYSFVEFKPKTGRMHQLRVHSKILGCPILGDVKYGGLSYKRIMLHAKQVVIPKEVFGSEMIIECNLPDPWFKLKI
ncbi:MAG: RluA family pseudouridine synthase [Rickettsiaceae bacterium]|nr:RluA family pseudouridine synthase [Rickettsiaceae bacterium]